MHPFEASWDRARSHLAAAERALGGAPHPARTEYLDWLEHNELELALDALEAAGGDGVLARARGGGGRDGARRAWRALRQPARGRAGRRRSLTRRCRWRGVMH